MLTFDTTISVYNSIYNPNTGFDDYFKTVIHKCSWFGKNRVTSVQDGIVEEKRFNVRIMNQSNTSSKQYVPPLEYTDPTTQYTLRPGDIIVRGDSANAPTSAKEYESLLTGNIDVFQVMDVHINDRVALKHIYVEGK